MLDGEESDNTRKPRLLDLFCGAGGCSVGYHRAGFDIVGVDIKNQPNYPYEFIRSDVFELKPGFLNSFDIIHASPPCQAYTPATNVARQKVGIEYPDLLSATRNFIADTGLPYVIENVEGAKKEMVRPMRLCGTMFKLRVYRHRLFEVSADTWVYPPGRCRHKGIMNEGYYVTVCGTSGIPFAQGDWATTTEDVRTILARMRERVSQRHICIDGLSNNDIVFLDWCDAMDIHWMTKRKKRADNQHDLAESIPPAYTKWIGSFLRNEVE